MAENQAPEFQPIPRRDVFISYASHDKAVAESVCKALESAGLICWIAPRDVVPGESFAGAIVHAIDATRVIVLVLSEHAAISQHVLREVERASSKRHPVIAFRIDLAPMPADLEYFLNTSQWLDASAAGVNHALPRLVNAVQSALAQPSTGAHVNPVAPAPARMRLGSRRVLFALGAVIAAVLAYTMTNKLWLSKRVDNPKSVATATPASGVSSAAATVVPEKSVAVLPFIDMSEKKDQEYFSEGLSEELIDLLSKVSALRVPARTSSFYFKDKSEDIPTIARRLMVAHVLEGSVRKAGDHVRITVQLVRADNGYHLWSQTYDRKLDDIFKVQDEIASAVVSALKMSLLGVEAPRAIPTQSSEAYTLYLQARSMYNNATSQADTERAFAYLRKALTLDARFAPAWATLAGYRCDDASYYEYNLGTQGRKEVRAAAARALTLNPTLPDAHYAMGKCLDVIEWDWKASEAELRRALELDPLNIDALLELADVLRKVDPHSREAMQLSKRAVEHDPLHAFNFVNLAMGFSLDDKFAEAEQAMHQALDLSQTSDGIHGLLARVLLYRGNAAMALTELEKEPREQFREGLRPKILDALGRTSEADRALAALEAKYANVMSYEIASVYARRKDFDRAFSWLDRAYRQHESPLPFLLSDPDVANLRSDPRYKTLLRKMNLSE
jgi:TolB-like protein/tetratricopeptide (TPR) repeat protein